MAVMVDGSTIVLTGTVDDGGWFWDDGFSAPDVIRALAAVGANTDVTVRINSGGGIATEGAAIHAALMRHGGKVTTVVEGIAASAASVIMMAGEDRIMTPGSVVMIHDPANITLGTIVDHQQTIGQLEAIATSMAGVYATASGQTAEQARADMLAETWLTPEEAVSRGYATSIASPPAGADEDGAEDVERETPPPAPFAYAQYRHPPERIAAMASANGWNHARARSPTADGAWRPFSVGDEVTILNPHDDGHATGVVQLVSGETPYGILVDGMEEMGIHKWYTTEELRLTGEEADPEAKRQKKRHKMPMPMAMSRPRAAVSAQPRQQETPMANENQGGGNPPPDADALRAQGYQAAVAYIGEVNDLCDLAGQRDKARAFIDAAKPIADIRRELVTAKASASENTTIHGQHDGSAPSAGTTPKPRLSAAQAMAKQLGLKGG